MSYLLTQMFLYMLATFLLGLFLGWLIWRNSQTETGDLDALRTERNAIAKERGELREKLEAARTRSNQDNDLNESLRAENADLQSRLDDCMASRDAAPAAAAVAAPVAFVGEVSKPEGLSGPRDGRADDLKEISGVGPKMERLLNDLGYYHFDQIAGWTPSEVAWVDDNLAEFKGRVTRDNWQDQARDLAGR